MTKDPITLFFLVTLFCYSFGCVIYGYKLLCESDDENDNN